MACRALRGAGDLPALRWSARHHASLGRDPGQSGWLPGEHAFVLPGLGLRRDAARVAGQVPVGADHAVAGDDDRDLVAAVGAADGARRAVELPGDLAVRGGLAVGDLAEPGPDGLLERRALLVER